MVITVTCPSCDAAFRVDSKKIPAGGVNGRCTKCGHIFRIEKPAERPAVARLPELPTPPPVQSQPASAPSAPVEAPSTLPAGGPPPLREAEPPPLPRAEPPASIRAEPTAGPGEIDDAPAGPAVEEPASAVQGFTFGKRDPTDKAKRLARVLVSDMIMYNAERHQTALAQGTLVQDFDEEIQKSWKEYVEQVGEEMANGEGRRFWVDALNDILAKGKEVF